MVKKLANGKAQLKIDILKSYQRIFDSEDGKMVLHDMMKTNGVFTTTFSENPYTMAYLEGRRSFVTQLLELLRKDVGSIQKLMKEQQDIQDLY